MNKPIDYRISPAYKTKKAQKAGHNGKAVSATEARNLRILLAQDKKALWKYLRKKES